MTAVVHPLCECELPGPFSCGVPGVLAWMKDGRVAPGARVERCDECQRLPSDEAARAKLVELGLADADSAAGDRTYNVHCLAIVRVTLHGIAAASHRQAAELARERFDFERDRATAKFADAFDGFLVDREGEAGSRESRQFTGALKEITG